MTPYFMVNEETLKRTPEEVREYLRLLRRRIQELEGTDSQRRIEELEATIRELKAEIADLHTAHQQPIQQLQQQLADACAKLGTNSTHSSLPPPRTAFTVNVARQPLPASPGRNVALSLATPTNNAHWSPRTGLAKPFLASPPPAAVVANL